MLENKVALVTGASRGIGRAIAERLAKDGATVIVNYNGSRDKAEAVVKEIEEAGGKAEAYQCSVADFAGVEEMMSYVIKTYGRIDILVNNAGITRDGLLMKMSEEDFDAVIATNLKGTFNCMRHVARQMIKQRGGRIINISSISGVMGNAGQMNYAASAILEVLCGIESRRTKTDLAPYSCRALSICFFSLISMHNKSKEVSRVLNACISSAMDLF